MKNIMNQEGIQISNHTGFQVLKFQALKFQALNHAGTLARLLMICMIAFVWLAAAKPAAAYSTKSGNFNGGYKLTGDLGMDMISVAKKQLGRNRASFGYEEGWCADFVLDCARVAKVPVTVIPYTTTSCASPTYFYNTILKKCHAVRVDASQAKTGDLVFYYRPSTNSYVHVGLYEGGGWYVDGNLSNKVTRYNTYYSDGKGHTTKNGGGITRVYVRPNYGDISAASVTLSTSAFTYNGGVQTPTTKVSMGGSVLKPETDYAVTMPRSVNAGTYTVTISGKGKYYGTRTVTYKINQLNINQLSFASLGRVCYNGKAQKPAIFAYGGPGNSASSFNRSKAFGVTYSSNVNPGRGYAKITGKGNFTGTKTMSFYIAPPKVAAPKLKVSGRTINASWNSAAGASGYEVSCRKKGSGSWKTVETGSANRSAAFKNLAILTNYEVRVRAFKKVDGLKVFGEYSGTTVIRTKIF